MTIRKIDEIKKMVENPLEEFFGIQKGSTEVTKFERRTELTPYKEYDTKDTELEENYQEIQDAAMTGYDNLQEMIDTADTKFAARLAEVSVQHLNVALAAASKKASLKSGKDNLLARQKATSKTNNTLIVMDRNEMLRNIMAVDADLAKSTKSEDDAIDADYTEVEDLDIPPLEPMQDEE